MLVRDVYESCTLWSFYACMAMFAGPRAEAAAYMAQKLPGGMRPILPLCFLPNWPSGEPFFVRTTLGVLQYVVIRATLAAATAALTWSVPEKYGDGE